MYYDEGGPEGEPPQHQRYASPSSGRSTASFAEAPPRMYEHVSQPEEPPMGSAEEGYDYYDYHSRGDDFTYGPHAHDEYTASSDYDTIAHRCRTGCLVTVWALCIVGVAILAVPLVILLLPYIKASIFPATEAPAVEPALTTNRPTTIPPVTPDQCLRTNARIPGAEKGLSDVTIEKLSAGPGAPPNGSQPVYCLFNVTRFRRPNGYFFLAQHLPLALCPAVVYWSWSLPNGSLTSRAEDFDEQYGLAVIKDVARNQSVNVDVILTLGGFPEDSADFHRASENQSIRNVLAQSAYDVYRKYNLSGVNLHWLPNSPTCEAPFKDVVPQLVQFIDVLRQLVSLHTPNATFKVTAIVDVEDVTAMKFFREHRSSLDVTFFKTHQLSQVNDFSDDYCDNSVPVFAYHVALAAPFFGTRPVPSATQKYLGLCVTMSLALYAGDANDTARPARPQIVSQMSGRMALFEVCDFKLEFKDSVKPLEGCLLRRTSGHYLNVTIALDNKKTLEAKMSTLGKPEDLCVLLYDIDFDNYRTGCSQQDQRYVMLQHFYSARIASSTFDVEDYLPKDH